RTWTSSLPMETWLAASQRLFSGLCSYARKATLFGRASIRHQQSRLDQAEARIGNSDEGDARSTAQTGNGKFPMTTRLWNWAVACAVSPFLFSVSAAEIPDAAPKFTGPGSCSAPSCHGSVRPRNENSVMQNEYSTWAVLDKHSHAASV